MAPAVCTIFLQTAGLRRAKSILRWSLLLWVAIPTPALSRAAPLEIEDSPVLLTERSLPTERVRDRLQAVALFAAGRIEEQRGDESAALGKYERAYRYEATATVLQEILRLAAGLDRREEAVRYALFADDIQGVEVELIRPLALGLTQQGEWESALKLYEVLLRRQNLAPPKNPTALPGFTELTVRQEATRLYFLTGRFADGAKIIGSLEAALADPEKFRLTSKQHQELLGEPNLTFHLFAECHLAAGEFAAAIRCFESAQKHRPQAGILGYNLARVERQQGLPEPAREHLQAYFSAKLAGEGAAPYKLLGELLTALDRSKNFDEQLAQLRAADPKNASLALFVAQRHLQAEKFDAAEAIYSELAPTASKRNAAEIYTGLLHCQWKLQKHAALLQTLGETEAQASSDVLEAALAAIAADEKVRLPLIELARARRNPTAAKLPPANESWTVAELALAAQDVATALEFFEFALQDQPKRRAELLETFGVMLLLADRTNESAAILRRGVEDKELLDRRTTFQFHLAGALAVTGETEEALAFARQAAESSPDDPRYASRVAWILQRAKRYDAALAVNLDLLERFDPRYDSATLRAALRDVRLTVSNLYVLQGKFDRAVEALERVLDEFPTHAGASNDLGYLWADRGLHLARAKRMIDRAVAAEPENRAFLDSLGWVEYRLENYAAAQVALEKAVRGAAKPSDELLEHLGDVYFKRNQLDQAQRHWQRAIDALPKDAPAARRQSLLQKLSAE
jgi:tetratricopeptide (TPR) repeat protein